MVTDPLISVIVPIYNSERFLEKCLDSIIGQTYDNLEILCVDDGSDDHSKEIIKKYETMDSRVRYFSKKNGGVSSARNWGIALAKGEFISFVDADDIIQINFLEKMYCEIVSHQDVEIAICNIKFLSEDGTEQLDIPVSCTEDRVVTIDATYAFKRGLQHLSACATLYKASLVRSVRFDESLFVGEDALFHNEVFLKCKKAVFIVDKLYYYVFHLDSAFKNGFSAKRLTEIEAWERIVSLYHSYQNAELSAKGELAIRCMTIYKLLCLDKKNKKQYGDFVLKRFRDNVRYVTCCEPEKKVEIECFLLHRSAWLFGVVYVWKKSISRGN